MTVATDKTDQTQMAGDHAPHHNALASAINTIIDQVAALEAQGVPIPRGIFDAKGDSIWASAADTAGRLPVGTNGQILTADSAQPLGVKWAAAAGGGLAASLVDFKGDLFAGTAADTAGILSIPSGGSSRSTLVTDSSTTTGLAWSPNTAPLNVLRYGADPTGVADSKAAIQAAINAGAGVAPVFIPPGNYRLDSSLSTPSKTHLYGVPGWSRLFLGAANTGAFIVTSSQVSDVLVEHLEFDGVKSTRGAIAEYGGLAIAFYGPSKTVRCSRITVRHCHLHDYKSLGLGMRNTTDSVMEGNYIHDGTRDGMGCYDNCARMRMNFNTVHTVGDDFIACHGGLVTGDVTTDVVAVGNVLGGGGTFAGGNMVISGSRRVIYAANEGFEGFGVGINIFNAYQNPSQDIIIANNILKDVGHNGPAGIGAGFGLITNGSNFYGVGGQAPIKNVLYVGNLVDNPHGAGMYIDSTDDAGVAGTSTISQITIAMNRFIGGPDTSLGNAMGLRFAAAGNVNNWNIIGNVFAEWPQAGIGLNGAADRMDIVSNRFLNNCKAAAGSALLLSSATNTWVHGNRFTDDRAVGSKTQNFAVNWGTSPSSDVVGNNGRGLGSGFFAGSKAGTSNSALNVDAGGAMIP